MKLLTKFYMADPAGGGGSPVNLKDAKALKDEFANIKNVIGDVGDALETSIGSQITALRAGMVGFDEDAEKAANRSLKSITSELTKAAKAVDKTRLQAEGLTKQFTTSKKIEENITALKAKQSNIESELLELALQGVVLSQQDLGNIDNANAALTRQLAIEQALLQKSLDREKAAGKMGQLFEGISKIPVLNKLVDSKAVLDKINKTAQETGSRWKAFGAGMKEVFSQIGKSLSDPVTYITGIFSLLKSIVTLVLDFNQKTFDIAKNLGVSVNEARKLQGQFIEIANSSANFGLTSKDIAKTYGEMSDTLGFMAPLNKGFAETATLLQKRLGLSAEAMGALATQSALSGKSLMDTYKTVESTRVVEGARNKLQLSQKQIIEGISKVSSQVLLNFKGSDGALAAAVVRAAKLGTNLDQINKQGETLLDFESSIASEFEAQLLTGRDLNLTRARELALAGDTRGVMEELNKQNVSLGEYERMNVIQRESFAKAVGLSTAELSKQLIEQEKAKKLGAEQGVSLQEQYNTLLKSGKSREEIIGLIDADAEADLKKGFNAGKISSCNRKAKRHLR